MRVFPVFVQIITEIVIMSAPVIKSSKMVSKVDETKRPKSTATTFKRDNSAVSTNYIYVAISFIRLLRSGLDKSPG